MPHLEKKFRVESFDEALKILREKNIDKTKESHSTHYYAPMNDGLVTKIVEDDEGVRLTQLKDINGTFEFVKREYVESLEKAIQWMHDNGLSDLKKVVMDSRIFEHEDGHIELIKINDGQLLSVILYFDSSENDAMTSLFGLTEANRIEVPYSELG